MTTDPARHRAWPADPAPTEGMLGFARRHRHGAALVIYAGVATATLLVAYGLRFDLAVPDDYRSALALHISVLVGLRLAAVALLGLTRVPWRYVGPDDVARLVAAATASSLPFVALFRGSAAFPNVPYSVVLMEWALFILSVAGMWLLYRHFHELARIRKTPVVERRRAPRKIAIVGAGENGNALARQLLRMPREYEVMGFLDDNPELKGARLQGIPVLGTVDEAAEVLPPLELNEVAIAIPSAQPTQLRRIVTALEGSRVPVKVMPGITQSLGGERTPDQLRTLRIEDLLGREPVTLALPELARDLEGTTVLVTGAAGSIGSELARQVAANHPARLVLLDQAESPLYWIDLELREQYPALRIDAVVADILDAERMDQVFATTTPDRVYHAAAYKHVPLMEDNPREALRNNVLGTWEVATRAGAFGTGRFVLISTDKAADPASVMGATKRAAEEVVQELQARYPATHYTAVRFGNVLGSNGSVLPLFQKQVEAGGPITITHPEVTRYFMMIPEAVQLVLQAGLLPEARGCIAMLDMGEPVKIVDLARNLVRLAGMRPELDIQFRYVGLRPGEKLHETLQGSTELLRPTTLASVHLLTIGAAFASGVPGRMEALTTTLRQGVPDARSARTLLAALWSGDANGVLGVVSLAPGLDVAPAPAPTDTRVSR
jgi:FlaA1/EpsC-like NDP-sugar epimerase